MTTIRVLIVEDSLTIRERLAELLGAESGIEVVGKAQDGKTAIELCQKLRPDVMTVDMVLPVLSGLAVTEYVMAYCPTPILIVSSSTNRGDLYKTYDALAAGALDALEKPQGNEGDGAWEQALVSAVRLVSRIKVITHVRGRRSEGSALQQIRSKTDGWGEGDYRLVAIGASTGGPAALATILKRLPQDFPLPIVVVNHIGEKFGSLLAEWLDGQSSLRVSCAVNGEPLPDVGCSRVILAPPGHHVLIQRGRLWLTNDPERHSCRPSVDIFFESVAREFGNRSIVCL